jgi:ATP-dependent DNA helicase DinG
MRVRGRAHRESGKSLIAEIVRRIMRERAFYICHSKTLQDQFVSDFEYAKVLKGRANYPTLNGPLDATCADCTKLNPMDDCRWCDRTEACPYEVAKGNAIRAKLSVLNTAYFLAEFNYVGNVGRQRELGIIDECDTLESELMGFAEFRLGERILRSCEVEPPKEGSHKKTIGAWLNEEFRPALYEYMRTVHGDDLSSIRERMRTERLMADVLRIGKQVEVDEQLTSWVRDVRAGPLVLKPVIVNDYGERYVWRHAKHWLCMSATIISADELADSTGLVGGQGEGEDGRRWGVVNVPMTFPVENRKITVAGVANMTQKGKQAGEWDRAARALHNVCLRHPNERMLVHTVSYELARFLMGRVASSLGRPVLTYSDARSRDNTLQRFLSTPNAVLIAPSMDRGVDLAGEQCRVIVVMKVPFPYLGDRQVAERMRLPGGQTWYSVQTVRKLVQMTGRAVRSKDDWCHTYILDQQFVKNLYRKQRGLFPAWWREAVDTRVDIRELLK